MEPQRLADVLNVNAIQYAKSTKARKMQAVVTYSKSTGKLRFNSKMVRLLGIEKWEAVLVGYDKTNKILVLKNVLIEEFGAVYVRTPHGEDKKDTRTVSIRSLLYSFGVDEDKSTGYRAQREGNMILLQEVDYNNERE